MTKFFLLPSRTSAQGGTRRAGPGCAGKSARRHRRRPAAEGRAAMAVDITLLFKASVKTVKTRNKALGVAVGDSARDELLKRSAARSKSDFTSRAREVVSAAAVIQTPGESEQQPGPPAACAGRRLVSGSARAPPRAARPHHPRPGVGRRVQLSPGAWGEQVGPGVARKQPKGSSFPHGCGLGEGERSVRAGSSAADGGGWRRLRARLSPLFPPAQLPLAGACSGAGVRRADPGDSAGRVSFLRGLTLVMVQTRLSFSLCRCRA